MKPISQLSLKNVVDFILAYRKGKAFLNWSLNEIQSEVFRAINEDRILISCDSAGLINGIVIGVFHGPETVHVKQALVRDRGTLKKIFQRMKDIYPNVTTLTAKRGEIFKTYTLSNLDKGL